MDQVPVLRVVIASPGDVKAEREIIPRVVEEVNRNIARPRGLHLDVYRWETDSYPGFHPEGPQGLIDPTLKIEDCDFLIAIFGKRFGKLVKDANSGTDHELRSAYKAWKKNGKPQIMVYFSQKKYIPKSKGEIDQARLILQFKKDFPRQGLWWDYKNKTEFEELARNHLAKFLSQQFPLDKPSPEPVTLTPLFQLPPPPADFTGRTSELTELRAAIEKGGVHISGLQGQGGVGKTALALKLAAELAPNFPDAQIYLDLKGVSEKPLTAAEAMSHVLRTFHPEARLPETVEELSPQYMSVLHNQRALLLMDNAKDAAQVKPLIPPEGCALLVTSRQHFALPGLQPENLRTLPPPDAKDLLLRIEPRIDGEAETIAKLCGYLPQALRLAASAIAVRVDLDPQDYAKQLADQKKRLELPAGGDQSVNASITLSYNLLDAETQRRWRLLAVFPDTFYSIAAAAVWEIETDAAKEALGRLLQYSMLDWNGSTKRYRLHGLMGDFARKQWTDAESEAAALRHAAHYGAILAVADDLYRKGGGDSITLGLALFDLEWRNIEQGQTWAAAHAFRHPEAAKLCSDYPNWGAYVLDLRRHPREQIRWREAALSAARQLKDQGAEGRTLANLGASYLDLGDYRRAIECYQQDLAITRDIGDRRGEGRGLGNLGLAHHLLGDYPRAIEYQKKALKSLRQLGDRRGEGQALGNLGTHYLDFGDSRRAIGYHEKALAIDREIGDRRGQGQDLGNLGIAYYSLGDCRRALEYHGKALAIDREIGDRRGEGADLWNVSLAMEELGDRKKAIEHSEAALKIFEQIEDPKAATVRKKLDIWRNG
jgi:tetratricopeptide (TPR) repeat protein